MFTPHYVSHVTCHLSHVKKKNVKNNFFYFFFYFFFYLKKVGKLVKLVGGGSVINGAYPVQFSKTIRFKTLKSNCFWKYVLYNRKLFKKRNQHFFESYVQLLASVILHLKLLHYMEFTLKRKNKLVWCKILLFAKRAGNQYWEN